MNINDNQLFSEIELLRNETSDPALTGQIVGAILHGQKTDSRYRLRFAKVGVPVVATGFVAISLLLVPFTASAHPIEQVRKALLSADEYRILTFEESAGKRVALTESWVKQGKRLTYVKGDQGEIKMLPSDLVLAKERVGEKLSLLTPEQLISERYQINPHKLISDAKLLDPDAGKQNDPAKQGIAPALTAEPKNQLTPEKHFKLRPFEFNLDESQVSKLLKVNAKPLLLKPTRLILPSLDEPLILKPAEFIVKPESIRPLKVKPFKLIPPSDKRSSQDDAQSLILSFVKSEMGIESLQILLKDENIWIVGEEVLFHDKFCPDGKLVQKYKLKDERINLTVYVNPETNYPILSQLRTLENGEAKTLEVEYYFEIPPKTLNDIELDSICDQSNLL